MTDARPVRLPRPVRRFDKHGEIRLMATSGGYVMVRRPGCIPFVLSLKEWSLLALANPGQG